MPACVQALEHAGHAGEDRGVQYVLGVVVRGRRRGRARRPRRRRSRPSGAGCRGAAGRRRSGARRRRERARPISANMCASDAVMSEAESTIVPSRSNSTADQVRVAVKDSQGRGAAAHRAILGYRCVSIHQVCWERLPEGRRGPARLAPVGSTRVIFSAEQAAAALWTYGEDALASQALLILEQDLPSLWTWAGDHWREDHSAAAEGQLGLGQDHRIRCHEFPRGPGEAAHAGATTTQDNRCPSSLRNARPVPASYAFFLGRSSIGRGSSVGRGRSRGRASRRSRARRSGCRDPRRACAPGA